MNILSAKDTELVNWALGIGPDKTVDKQQPLLILFIPASYEHILRYRTTIMVCSSLEFD